MEYKQIQNGHAFKMLNKSVQNPDAALGIGYGEDLTPQPQYVVYPSILKEPSIPDITSVSIDRAMIDGYAESVSDSDFPKELYIGDAIGGF